jgi:hypothetical protein
VAKSCACALQLGTSPSLLPPPPPAGLWQQLAEGVRQLTSGLPSLGQLQLPAAPGLRLPATPELHLPEFHLPAFPPALPPLPAQQQLSELLGAQQPHWGSAAAARGLQQAAHALSALLDTQGVTPAVSGAFQQLKEGLQQALGSAPAPVAAGLRGAEQLSGLLAAAAQQLAGGAAGTAEGLQQQQHLLQAQLAEVGCAARPRLPRCLGCGAGGHLQPLLFSRHGCTPRAAAPSRR